MGPRPPGHLRGTKKNKKEEREKRGEEREKKEKGKKKGQIREKMDGKIIQHVEWGAKITDQLGPPGCDLLDTPLNLYM